MIKADQTARRGRYSTLPPLSGPPRYPAGRLAATGMLFSLRTTRPSFSSGSQAKPTGETTQSADTSGQKGSETRARRSTLSLHQVPLLGAGLAVAVAADVVQGEEEVVLLVELRRQLHLELWDKEAACHTLGPTEPHAHATLPCFSPRRRIRGCVGDATLRQRHFW